MALLGITGVQALLANARLDIDAAEALLTAPGASVGDIARAQFRIIEGQAALAKALVMADNVEDAIDAN